MSCRIAGLGEVLWDLLPCGRQLGGAPANFAFHARSLGADARVISRAGADPLGRELLARFAELGLPADSIQIDPEAPTSTVSVEVDAAGQPRFTIHRPVAWDRLAPVPAALEAAAAAHAVCFGTLAQRGEPARSTIRALLRATPPGALRIFDINLRQDFYSRALIEESLALANVLKVNDSELPILCGYFGIVGGEPESLRQLAERFDLRAVALTRGARGSLLFSQGRFSDHPGVTARVVDTVGAGDAFTAALALGLFAGWELDKISGLANRIAAFVASSAGATPTLPPELRAPFLDI